MNPRQISESMVREWAHRHSEEYSGTQYNNCGNIAQNSSTITYYVFSTQGPDSSALLPIQAPDTGLGAALGQLFPGGVTYDWAHTDAGNYLFSYQNGNYVQDTFGITGSIRGH